MTVPTDFRRNSEIPGLLKLHYGDLPEGDVKTARGFKYTRPLRTILDIIETGTIEQNFIRQAVWQAFNRGLIPWRQIDSTPMSETARNLIADVVRRAA